MQSMNYETITAWEQTTNSPMKTKTNKGLCKCLTHFWAWKSLNILLFFLILSFSSIYIIIALYGNVQERKEMSIFLTQNYKKFAFLLFSE